MADPELRHVSAAGLPGVRELLVEVYVEVYADRLADPFFSRERFDERRTGHEPFPYSPLYSTMVRQLNGTAGAVHGAA